MIEDEDSFVLYLPSSKRNSAHNKSVKIQLNTVVLRGFWVFVPGFLTWALIGIDSLLEPQVAIQGTAATVTTLQKYAYTRPVRTDQSECFFREGSI